MRKTQSVISLDPIDLNKKRQDSIMSRLFKTRHHGGKGIKKEIPYGHYMFCGEQGSGKTMSMLWYLEYLTKKFKKKGYKIQAVYSNFGIGREITKATLFPTIYNLPAIEADEKVINFILIDEIQSYFPKDFADRGTKELIGQLVGCFSQLRKRHCFVLSTSQVYGRLDKTLREQVLYMINCRKSKITNRVVNDFIRGSQILCDELGRWSGIADFIIVHGLSKISYDSSRLIRE